MLNENLFDCLNGDGECFFFFPRGLLFVFNKKRTVFIINSILFHWKNVSKLMSRRNIRNREENV